MKELLVFVGGYFPSYSAPGMVLEKMIPELQKYYRITIISPRRSNHQFGDHFIHNGCDVFEVSDYLQDRCVESMGFKYKAWRVLQEVWRIIERHPIFVFNQHKASSLAERLNSEFGFHAILSISFPPYAHLVAWALKRRHPEMRWVAYSTDTMYHHPMMKSWWGRMTLSHLAKRELQAYQHADAVFLAPEIYALRNEMFADGQVIPQKQEYILSIDAQHMNCTPRCAETFEVVYAGAFYEEIRNPRWFVSVIRKVLEQNFKVRFSFYLVSNACRDQFADLQMHFPNGVRVCPPVLPSELRRIMSEADVLLNFSNDADQFSPSKFYDYLARGLPIVDVVYPHRKINEVEKRHPLCLTLVNNEDADRAARVLMDFFIRTAGMSLSYNDIKSLYPEYLPENALRSLAACLDDFHQEKDAEGVARL